MLLSLNFPRRPQASPDADPEPLRMLRARVEAPKLAAKLQQAGVSSRSRTAASHVVRLPRATRRARWRRPHADQAVRALTLTPAEILGVSDRLGTIEVGKIANLTVTRGDLFTGRVAHVFVDGAPIEARAPGRRRRVAGERHVDDHRDDRRRREAGDADGATGRRPAPRHDPGRRSAVHRFLMGRSAPDGATCKFSRDR